MSEMICKGIDITVSIEKKEMKARQFLEMDLPEIVYTPPLPANGAAPACRIVVSEHGGDTACAE